MRRHGGCGKDKANTTRRRHKDNSLGDRGEGDNMRSMVTRPESEGEADGDGEDESEDERGTRAGARVRAGDT